MDINAKSLVV